ncbi:MAG: Rpn family recombination-promoting nuclease/putative transposase [Treponema sp.]|nr:Rpn family recombination-promoting nuclease/putative transposase [Treponema sp.]
MKLLLIHFHVIFFLEVSVSVNREHKSSVFSFVFGHEDTLRELYSALKGVHLPLDLPLKIDTLEDALFKTKINDISFEIGDKLVVLIEHQSTINPNMPVRLLSYIARIYEKILSGKKNAKLYGKKGLSLPRPEFIILYNGLDSCPDTMTIRLSESFADVASLGLPKDAPPDLELVARVYNINKGHNQAIVQRSEKLNGYAAFIAKVRDCEAELLGGKKRGGFSKEDRANIEKAAMEKAVKWSITHNILKDFMETHGTEVINMLFDEWKLEEALVVEREEGRAEGREEGREEGWAEGREEGRVEGREEGWAEGRVEGLELVARNLLTKGLPPALIQETTGLDMETIENLGTGL